MAFVTSFLYKVFKERMITQPSNIQDNNTQNSTHGVGFYVYESLDAVKEHKSTCNDIWEYDLREDASFCSDINIKQSLNDIVSKIPSQNLSQINFNINLFNSSPFTTIIDILSSSSNLGNDITTQTRLNTSNFLKQFFDGVKFEQSNSIAYCIFNISVLQNEKQIN